MSMTICGICQEMKDTDFDNGEFSADEYICEDCISACSDEELEGHGVTR